MEIKRFLHHLTCFARNRIPPQLVIQITSKCNARCPQCGMRITSDIKRSTLDMDTIKQILDAAAEKGVQAVSFTGGEPLLDVDRLVEMIHYAGQAGIPYIRTGTNGFVFRNCHKPNAEARIQNLVEKLADTPLRNFWISLDSADIQVHENSRGLPGVARGIETALPIFHSHGIYPSVNLGINRMVGGHRTLDLDPLNTAENDQYLEEFYVRFKTAFHEFYRLARNLGFSIANTCYPMSIDPDELSNGLSAVYAATATDRIVSFTPREKSVLYRALLDVIPHHRAYMRIFTPLSALYMMSQQHDGTDNPSIQPGCRGGHDFFFIHSDDANTYPCGYRGDENLGPFNQLDLKSLKPAAESCRRCDWECFRDPSEFIAPFMDIFHRPLALIQRLKSDPRFFSLWKTDLFYYYACHLFNGREKMDTKRLARFNLSDTVTHSPIKPFEYKYGRHS